MEISDSKQVECLLKKQNEADRKQLIKGIEEFRCCCMKKLKGQDCCILSLQNGKALVRRDGRVIYLKVFDDKEQLEIERNLNQIRQAIFDVIDDISPSKMKECYQFVERQVSVSWEDLKEEEADSEDIQMLEAMKNNPDCNVFTKAYEINWE